MICNIRGSHGCGKSTTVRAVMARGVVKPIFGLLGPRLPEAYELTLPSTDVPLFVVGPYLTDCGGCDRIPRNATVMALIEKYAERGHVLFEGSLLSSTYGAVGTMLECWGKDAVFVFLDTTLEEWLERVEARRGRKRDERLIKNVTAKYRSGWRVHERVVREGKTHAVITSSENAPDVLLKLLCKATL